MWEIQNDVGTSQTSTPSPCVTACCFKPLFHPFASRPLANLHFLICALSFPVERQLADLRATICLYFSYGNIVSDLCPLLQERN